jgi:hypothetical protein
MIETVSAISFVTAKSLSRSPLKLAMATADGPSPIGKFVGPVNVPPALPSRIETESAAWLATSKSGSLSALKSPAVTASGRFATL